MSEDNRKRVLFPENLNSVGKFRDEYSQGLLEAIECGYTIRQYAISIGVTLRTLENWGVKFDEFKLALALACEYELSQYEEYAKGAASGESKGNATMIKFLLTNKDSKRYSEKREIEHKGSITLIDTGIKRPGDPDFLDYCKKHNIDPNDFIEADYKEVDSVNERGDAPKGERHLITNEVKKGRDFL